MKRLLFVDDEPAPLNALRRVLYRERDRWQMRFVTSAELAIAELEREPCDVIVSDMRMPRVDGAELLRIVSERWPQTIRIVLSGYADASQTMRLVPVAHQYLAKPCDVGRLEQAIERSLQLHELLHQPTLRALVGTVRKLPTIPRVYGNLTALMAREDPTVAEVAHIVAEDSAIVAKVLHVVNSAFFRVARPITNIEQAVAYLGFGPIRSLVLSSEVFQQWPAAIAHEFEPQQLQAHVRDVAAGAYALARETPWAEEALIAGLLHDIGYWVLLQERPSEMLQTLQLAQDAGLTLPEAERRVFGTTHAEVGAYLLGLWGLQYSIVEAVAFHHAPLGLPHDRFDPTAALAMAHLIDETGASESSFEGRLGAPMLLDDAARASFRAPFDWLEAERRVAESHEPRICA